MNGNASNNFRTSQMHPECLCILCICTCGHLSMCVGEEVAVVDGGDALHAQIYTSKDIFSFM